MAPQPTRRQVQLWFVDDRLAGKDMFGDATRPVLSGVERSTNSPSLGRTA